MHLWRLCSQQRGKLIDPEYPLELEGPIKEKEMKVNSQGGDGGTTADSCCDLREGVEVDRWC